MAFVAGFIDHEIRNVLTGVIGVGDYLEEDVSNIHKALVEDNDMEKTEECINSLHKNISTLNHASDLLNSIVNDGVDIRKLREGKIEAMPEPYRFGELIERVFHILQPKIVEAENVKIHASIFDKKNYYKFDKHRVQQVLMNFISF